MQCLVTSIPPKIFFSSCEPSRWASSQQPGLNLPRSGGPYVLHSAHRNSVKRGSPALWKEPSHLLIQSSTDREHHSPGPLPGKVDRKPGMVTHVCNSSIWKQKQMDHFELEARLGYRVRARLARAIGLCSKQKKTSTMGTDSGDSGETEMKESMIIWAGWPLMSSFAIRLTKKQTKQTC